MCTSAVTPPSLAVGFGSEPSIFIFTIALVVFLQSRNACERRFRFTSERGGDATSYGRANYFRRTVRTPQPAGDGGFAHTYKARVLDDDLRELYDAEVVALKDPLNKKKELVLQREIEMGASLHLRLKGINSLNIVRYLGFTVFRGKIVMLMEYIAREACGTGWAKLAGSGACPLKKGSESRKAFWRAWR